jgi:Tc toxin complex TcA C-terminal TcB-binding domain/ABC toxin N-terminal region/Neuraminidase-like domain/Salmonella virulence plasmid 28.1kDa A protein/PA14 domain
MKTLKQTIATDETSLNVTQLHKALDALGYTVNKSETKKYKAGNNTKKQVKKFQTKHNIQGDDSVVANETTLRAIGDELKNKGLTETKDTFTISGTVYNSLGQIQKRKQLLAFDVDLKGAATYITETDLTAVMQNPGFEFLGEATSNNQGYYTVTFYAWQFENAERKKADVVVFAVEENKIIGRSRMVNSEDYSEKGLVRDLDVLITETDDTVEYDSMMGLLLPFLEESDVQLYQIAESADQLTFTAGELEIEQTRVEIAAQAKLLQVDEDDLSHEILYGIGRQGVKMQWSSLYKKSADELKTLIQKSVDERIINEQDESTITEFLRIIEQASINYMLDDEKTGSTVNARLSISLPEENQRISFMSAIRSFEDADYSKFWNEYLPEQAEFKDKPELISSLLFTQQLTALSGNFDGLITELASTRGFSTMEELIELDQEAWEEIVGVSGIPDFITGEDEAEKTTAYVKSLKTTVDSAFPTLRIASMLDKNELPVVKGISDFLNKNSNFQFEKSRIHDFENQILAIAGENYEEVKDELFRMQRVFQVSPSPEVMSILMDKELNSARTIAGIPLKSFIKKYSSELGGDDIAEATHRRARVISTRTEFMATHILDHTTSLTPEAVMSVADIDSNKEVIEGSLPNYSELFGSPDICECKHCSSVYSAAAYFVDLMQFLKNGNDSDGENPLKILEDRRPDLRHLQLTCENINTIVPYIDMANEIMEYYVFKDGEMESFVGYNTGDATADEIRSNPQNFEIKAYEKLKDAVFPFDLPYHQPIDVIRTYCDFLSYSRYSIMKAIHPNPDDSQQRALDAEYLEFSPEQYSYVTGQDFKEDDTLKDVWKYYGYENESDLDKLAEARTYITKTGIDYTDLVELLKTKFINPGIERLNFIEQVFSYSELSSNEVYELLEKIEAGSTDPDVHNTIDEVIDEYNDNNDQNLDLGEFEDWVKDNFSSLRSLITLYEENSACNLDNTYLKTIESIYTFNPSSGIEKESWLKLHRFIRLWRKLGWTIDELNIVLSAIGARDITSDVLTNIKLISEIKDKTNRPIDQLSVFWGEIDTDGDNPLYKRLFLSRSMKPVNLAFEANEWGVYLTGSEKITDHASTIMSAFRIDEEEFNLILKSEGVEDADLDLSNVSRVYRYVEFSKAIGMDISEVCKLMVLFSEKPFSTWDGSSFIDIEPANTLSFIELAKQVEESGFTGDQLDYIFNATKHIDKGVGLEDSAILETLKTIRGEFDIVETTYPDVPETPYSAESIQSLLSLTFDESLCSDLLEIVQESFTHFASADSALKIVIPDDIISSMSYSTESGLLTCTGFLKESDVDKLKTPGALDDGSMSENDDPSFVAAIDELSEYLYPSTFISENFNGLFADLEISLIELIDEDDPYTSEMLEDRLEYLYQNYLPLIKTKLKQDVLVKHIASLLGLTDETTTLVLGTELNILIEKVSEKGFYAQYYIDATHSTEVIDPITGGPLTEVYTEINNDWEADTPHPIVSPDNFGIKWEAYLMPPITDDYSLFIHHSDDDIFSVWLDDSELEFESADDGSDLDWKTKDILKLNSDNIYKIRIDYGDNSGDAGIQLYWKTATTGKEIISTSYAIPMNNATAFVNKINLKDRAALFVKDFELTDIELDYVLQNPVYFGANDFDAIDFDAIDFDANDFDAIDFDNLSSDDWRIIKQLTDFRNTIPQSDKLLTEVFAAACKIEYDPSNSTSVAETITSLIDELCLATGWSSSDLKSFIDNDVVEIGVNGFKNTEKVSQLASAFELLSAIGISAETLVTLGGAHTDFDDLHSTALTWKEIVKAKYETEDWLEVGASLSDTIRTNQQKALVSYLLVHDEIIKAKVTDADGLFEYFLIDVQMEPCMETSRIVQANTSIQMYVNRCLLNLESDTDEDGNEIGVLPDAIDRDRWEWMKFYRVWEANRKIFIYPENWLAPEWRNNRSEFFKELESYLTQNDISERSVEKAFRNYLTSLNEVANLEICGMCKETTKSGEVLHVFARTNNAPYKYLYRTRNEFEKWSAWESVQLDIKGSEGENSGAHLIPVVWKNRLFLFWPEFTAAQNESDNSSDSVEDMSTQRSSSMESITYYEIRLASSEYVESSWSSKQLSKEFINTPINWRGLDTAYLTFHTQISFIDESLSIHAYLRFNLWDWNWHRLGTFELTNISAPLVANDNWSSGNLNQLLDYKAKFMSHAKSGKLHLDGYTYLSENVAHRLLHPNDVFEFENEKGIPFFYFDKSRSFFIDPQTTPTLVRIISPDSCMPVFDTIYEGVGFISSVGGSISDQESLTDRRVFYDSSGILIGNSLVTDINQGYSNDETSSSTNLYVEPLNSFGGVAGYVIPGMQLISSDNLGLEFHTFHHPYSNQYVRNLNLGGIQGLLESDTLIEDDNGATFENNYDPNFNNGIVRKPSDFEDRTYYKENVCFDENGANSLYNTELFFHAPLYIATRLSKNGKYEEAMNWFHYIFDPTTDEAPSGDSATSRYWKFKPFKTTTGQSMEEWFLQLNAETTDGESEYVEDVEEWLANPFDTHLVAAGRPLAYMKHVVIKYVENIVAWGDSLFRQFTRESVMEALQLYVIANKILGPYPQFIPRRGEISVETYATIEGKLDAFGNALVELENLFPYSSGVYSTGEDTGTSLLGVGSSLYFCIPYNDQLLDTWEIVSDRLYKIRHCQNIDGIEMPLALFAPPIDPAMLVQAFAQGLSLGSILADLSSPPPLYRFTYLIQKANEFCNDVKSLGSSVLSAIEKRDGEELGRLRASHESAMLDLMTAIKERQILEAKASKENLQKSRETAIFRLQHYLALLGNESASVPDEPTVDADLNSSSQLPADSTMEEVVVDVDESLVDNDEESGVKLLKREQEDLDKSKGAQDWQRTASISEELAGVLGLIPELATDVKPLGIGGGFTIGGKQFAGIASAFARYAGYIGSEKAFKASLASKMAGFIRREQDWTLQANLAAKEIIQIDKQITSADIRIQVTEKELENHNKQIKNAEEIEQFLKDKFSNQELYTWMKEQLFAVYKQAYNLSYDMAKKAEKAYKFELGLEMANFIQYGYWDNSMSGLVSGDKLQLALRQLEKSYIEENKRELELKKNISLALLDPLALLELRETGTCRVSIPEEIFDLDFQCHYFRRIKSVSLSIPCIVGPYTTVACSLHLMENHIRTKNTYANGYARDFEAGDVRFRSNIIPVSSIATSNGQNDAGMFELNFNDARYLAFEGAGVISKWNIVFTERNSLQQFDYESINDVIIHMNYTAREDRGTFMTKVVDYMEGTYLKADPETLQVPLMKLVNIRQDFPNDWYKFSNTELTGDLKTADLSFELTKEMFPYIVQHGSASVSKIQLFVKSAEDVSVHKLSSYYCDSGDTQLSTGNEISGVLIDGLVSLTISEETFEVLESSIHKLVFEDFTDGIEKVKDDIEDVYLLFYFNM